MMSVYRRRIPFLLINERDNFPWRQVVGATATVTLLNEEIEGYKLPR
jgi:hypothetical protein